MNAQSSERRLPQVKDMYGFVEPISNTIEMRELINSTEVNSYAGKRVRSFRYAREMFNAYLDVFEYFDALSTADLDRAESAIIASYCGETVRTGRFTASIAGAKILKERNISLVAMVKECVNSDNQNFASVKNVFAHMFNVGTNTKAESLQHNTSIPAFSDPYWDDILVGQLLVESPVAMIHFIISHALSLSIRLACRELGDSTINDAVDNKETVHGIIGIVLRIMIARGVADSEIETSWKLPHNQNGVAWHAKQYNCSSQQISIQSVFNQEFR
jgi:hypothetical protein